MGKRTREEFEKLAAKVRKEFYARAPAERNGHDRRNRPVRPARRAVDRPPPGERTAARAGKRAEPCPGSNKWWQGLPAKALAMATTVTSPNASDEIYKLRQSECAKCPYSGEVDGERYCGCCGCPKRQFGRFGSHLGYKNRKAGWACPRPAPAFGPVEVTKTGSDSDPV